MFKRVNFLKRASWRYVFGSSLFSAEMTHPLINVNEHCNFALDNFQYRHVYSKHISWRQLKLNRSTVSARTRVYSLAFSRKQMQRSSIQRRTTSENLYAQTRRFQLQWKTSCKQTQNEFRWEPLEVQWDRRLLYLCAWKSIGTNVSGAERVKGLFFFHIFSV